MNSLSSQPFWKMCHSIPQITGMSVPERMRTYSVACAAVRVNRGSITIMLARLISFPASTCCIATGCASAGLPPMMIMVLALRNIVVGIGLGTVAPGVGDPGHRRRVADAGLVVDRAGAPERPHLAEQVGRLVGEFGRAEPVHRIGAGFLPDRENLVADLLDRLLP